MLGGRAGPNQKGRGWGVDMMGPILHMRKLSPKKPSHLPTDTELVNGRARNLIGDRQNSLSDSYFSSINANVGSNREDMEASPKFQGIQTGSLRTNFGLCICFVQPTESLIKITFKY